MRLQRNHTAQLDIYIPGRDALWWPAMGSGWEGEAKIGWPSHKGSVSEAWVR